MRKITYFVMALALVLGFTQCKKEQVNTPGNETKTVNITLNVGGNGGSRHTIDTENGDVDFQDGDVIYVGDGSTYIGSLTRTDGVFSGPINEPADGTEIYFFFVGGLPTTPADLSGQSSFTVDISDQSTEMPVLSCNHVTYSSSTTSYSCVLQNQCALVEFTTVSTTDHVHVGGLYTGATINFGTETPGITNNGTTGFVALNSKSATEKWAVLLPQTGFEGAEAAIAHVGYTTTIPTIAADGFITGDAAISISTLSNIVYLDWITSGYTATDGQTLKGTLSGNYQISIAADATVTLRNANITSLTDADYAGITCKNDANIILEGTNTVVGGLSDGWGDYPGIYIAEGHKLTIDGTGTLVAKCGVYGTDNGEACGIGGGFSLSCGNIEILGGTIYAYGGEGAAGIGGGWADLDNANCGYITISGGTIHATGGLYSPGIGNGYGGTCGTITISGGTITATGGDGDGTEGGKGGAGIGNASWGECGDITIYNTVTSVTATKGSGAINSIGNGPNAICGTVEIGGTVYYQNNAYVGDGATYLTQSTLVYPTPTPVEQIVDLSTITSAYTAVDGDILTGTLGTGVQISIADGATITLRSANINGSDNLSGTFHGLNCLGDATIILENNDNVVKAKCGENDGRAGIFVPRYKTLTIQAGNSSGKIDATGAGEASGIGGYYHTNCGAIVINSGKVNATAGSNMYDYGYGAGIGACGMSRCDGITITGGQTIARAFGYAAGIGTGGEEYATGYCNPGDQDAITINISSGDGWVKAYKGSDATYFIGGGGSVHCGYVKVGGINYEDNGNRGITSNTPGTHELSVYESSVVYMP